MGHYDNGSARFSIMNIAYAASYVRLSSAACMHGKLSCAICTGRTLLESAATGSAPAGASEFMVMSPLGQIWP